MSHNYPYRQAPSDPRSDPRAHSSAGGANFYRRPQESFPSSSRSSAASQSPQDGVLSLLSSCGLEPGDLAVLAKLPEDVLTVDSLPHLIKQIKGKKGTVRPLSPPPPSSHSFSSTHRPSASSSSSLDWDKLRRQPVQYPLHMISSSAPLSDTHSDHWGSRSSVRASSVRPVRDTDLRPRLSDYGKAASSCSSVELKRGRPSRFSDPGSADYRSVPPPDERRRRRSGSAGVREPAGPVPSKQQALDFHGSLPPVYPYSCSLCEITVLSEKVWLDHINGTVHADGQLKLLQQFTNWDCRVKHSNRDEDQSQRRRAGASSAPSAQRPNRSQAVSQPNRKLRTPTDRGRVVCVKFPAQSVDEAYLQSCIEPFGKMGKILMFPSVAFVELGTADQAKDLVKFYSNLSPAENKQQLDFSISNTFSFLQSSQVVSFTPAPSGKDGRSDLTSIIKRFGEPLYSLFLPSKAFVEMKLAGDAKKLVDYYSSNVLKINEDSIRVSFSTEYKSLMRVSLATRCDEEPTETATSGTKEPGSEKTTRSRSTGRTRIRSRSRERVRGRSSHRSRSRDRSRRDGRTRTRSRENRGKSSKETKSKSEETSNNSSTGQNQTDETTEEPKKPEKPEGSEKPEKPEGSEKPEKPEGSEKPGDPEGSEKPGDPEGAEKPGDPEGSEKPGDPEGSEKPGDPEGSEKPGDPEGSEKPGDPEGSDKPEEPATGAETRSAAEPEDKSGPDAAEEEQLGEEQLGVEQPGEEQPGEEQPEEEQPEEEQPEEEQPEEEQPEEEQPEEEQLEEELRLSADDSDIEGMEVIAEDGEKLKEEDEESQEETSHLEETTASPEGEDDNEVKSMELDDDEEEERRVTIEEEHEAADMEDDEESGFPVDLENCITLDEVGCDEGGSDQEAGSDRGAGSDHWGPWAGSESSESSRVLFFSSMPENYSDVELVQVMRGLGTVVRYLLVNDRQQGFIEMSSPSEAQTAVQVLESEPVLVNGTRLMGCLSQEYPSLSDGWAVPSDEEETQNLNESRTDGTPELETTLDQRMASKDFPEVDPSGTTPMLETSETFKDTKTEETSELETPETFQETPEKETTSVRRTRSKRIPQTTTTDRKTRSKKIPDKASPRRTRSQMTPEETETSETVPETCPDTETSVEETPETGVSEKTPKTEFSSKTSEELRTTPEKGQTGRKTGKGKTTSRKVSETRTDKRKGSPEDDAVPLKTTRTDLEEAAPKETKKPKDEKEKSTKEEEPENLDHPGPPEQDSEVEQQPAPAEGATEPEQPSRPVGPEFVRPVVGYFCNLCQLIFIDEDEAKLQHCSTPEHYRKYQEKTGKDPWSS